MANLYLCNTFSYLYYLKPDYGKNEICAKNIKTNMNHRQSALCKLLCLIGNRISFGFSRQS